jgi:hypothetical protein
MNRLLAILAAAVFAALVPMQAAAAPVVLTDPIIGVRGRALGASAPLTDPTPQPFEPCEASFGLPAGYICSDYEITPEFSAGIFSVDLTFQNTGTPIPVSLLQLDPLSGFNTITVLGPYTIRLSGGTAPGGALDCGIPTTGFCTALNDAIVFISDQNRCDGEFTVALTAVNGVSTVPEPGTLLLLAASLALLARYRPRRALA